MVQTAAALPSGDDPRLADEVHALFAAVGPPARHDDASAADADDQVPELQGKE